MFKSSMSQINAKWQKLKKDIAVSHIEINIAVYGNEKIFISWNR